MTEDVKEREARLYSVKSKENISRQDAMEHVTFNDVIKDVNVYKPENMSTKDEQKAVEKISTILSVITSIGMIVAVLMSGILGLKYMLGSVEEKADYKKDMIPYLVGAILLFGICTVVKVLQQWGETINNI